jgi:hypothetical protein
MRELQTSSLAAAASKKLEEAGVVNQELKRHLNELLDKGYSLDDPAIRSLMAIHT